MQTYKVPHVNSLCRACLQILVKDNVDSSTTKHDIFQTDELSEKFVLCTSLDCVPSDGLPKYMCNCCYNKVNDFHQFQAMCIESAKRFGAFREPSQMMMPFEDEKPEFDLELQTKIEITVSEPDVLFQSEVIDSENNDALEDKYELNNTKVEKVKIKGDMKRGCRSEATKRNRKKRDSEKKPADRLRRGRSRCVVPTITDNIQSKESEALKEHYEPIELDFEYPFEEAGANKAADLTTVKISKKTALRERKFENFGSKRRKSSMLQCDVCPARFVVEHRLIAHKRSHEGLVPYLCPHNNCGKAFKRWEGLSEHLKEHEVRRESFRCEKDGCDKVYRSQLSLALHQRTYHKYYKYICETCGKSFKTMSLLKDHSYSHKDNSELPHVCEQCDRHFTQKRSLKEHLLRHAGIKNFICPHCGVGKTTLNELKYHINYHTLERRWPCRLCTHVSNKGDNLNRHIRTVHERIKNYACRYCERLFANCKTLRHHEMIHTGEKPHECQECGKRFIQLSTLRTHQKTHPSFRIATTTRIVPLVTTDGVKGDDVSGEPEPDT